MKDDVHEVLDTIVEHLADIAFGRCRISDDMIEGASNPMLAEALAGMSMLHETLDYERKKEKEARDALLEAIKAAEDASMAKSHFLAVTSHEIRTPLNAIIGLTRLTLDSKLDHEQRENLELARDASESLLAVINDLLDLSKVEADRLEMESIPTDLWSTVESSIDALALRAQQSGLEMVCHIESDVPRHVMADPTRLRQVLLNLLSNAVKFTAEGEVLVQVACESPENPMRIRFSVSDTGIGINPDQIERIFQPFTQADGSITRHYGGTGLGLALSRRLVDMMGGRLTVESNPGEGAAFSFVVPLETAEMAPTARPSAQANIRDLRVLIVDDNATNRRVLTKMLEGFGCCPHAVDGGLVALDELTRAAAVGEHYELVLLDLMMPALDGIATAERIQAERSLRDVPIMMLTSHGERGDRERYREIGVQGYLLKPVKRRQLHEALGWALSGADDQEPTSFVTQGVLDRVVYEDARVLLVEDNRLNQRYALKIFQRAGLRVTIADNGRKAVQAADAENFDLILMDLQMPEMDGFEATREIRRRELRRGRRVPIVAMTAEVAEGTLPRCQEVGMDDFVSKPVTPEDLDGVLDRWLNGGVRTSRPPIDPREAPAEPEAAEEPVFDIVEWLGRFGGEADLAGELAEIFLEDFPQQFADLQRALTDHDVDGSVANAHALKGMTANFGASGLSARLSEIEKLSRAERLERAAPLLDGVKKLYDDVERALAAFMARRKPARAS